MGHRLFSKLVLALVLCTVSFVWSFNYVVDPYGWNLKFIFTGNLEKLSRDERISKFNLAQDNYKAKSFIFGSSRSLMMDPIKLAGYTGDEALNLGFSSASPSEYVLFIKYLIETRDVSNIVIGIDLFSYTEKFESNGVMPSKLLDYFNINNGYSIKNYLSFKMFKRSRDTLIKNHDESVLASRYTDRGKIIKRDYMAMISDRELLHQYVVRNVVNDAVRWGSKSSTLSEELLTYLLNIKTICDANNINLHLFMSPIYINQILMKGSRFGQQTKLLKYIATNIHPIYDFNGITSFNTDPLSFLDSFHYSYDVADFILKEIFSSKRINGNHKGFLVTKDNVDDYILTIDKRVTSYIRAQN